MPPKQGNLRVLKRGQSIYGPMSKADLEQLIAQGRIGVNDQVSVNEGPWRMISEFLAGATASPSSTPGSASPSKTRAAATANPTSLSTPSEKALQVLSGDKIYGPMSRDQVKQLVTAGRLKIDDLICAIDGPWMPLADFLAPAAQDGMYHATVSSPPAASTDVPLGAMSPAAMPRPLPPPVPGSSAGMSLSLPLPASVDDAKDAEIIELTLADVVEPDGLGLAPIDEPTTPRMLPLSNPSLLDALELEPVLSTRPEWFVKIRGMTSSHLTMSHLKTLVIAREIHPETPTAHISWDDTDWRPFRAVRELAGLLKFIPT